MKEFIDKLIERLEEAKKNAKPWDECGIGNAISIVNELAEEYKGKSVKGDLISRSHVIKELNEIYLDNPWDSKEDILEKAIGIVEYINCSTDISTKSTDCSTNVSEMPTGWIPCSERLPECENKYGWVSCIVSVIRSHYPTSPYDICDSPYDENIVMHANYHVSQKIWHLESDEQLNALIDIEDAPLNGDYVIAWQPLPAPYTKGE